MLDPEYEAASEAAAELCAELGEATHAPTNPGWPAERFELAAKGARSCNLLGPHGNGSPAQIIPSTMSDSDDSNVWEVGHRRWNLGHLFGRTGFGSKEGFVAMWAVDASRKDAPGYRWIGWPPEGYVPVDFWVAMSRVGREPPWSIHLNPDALDLPERGVPTVAMWRVAARPPQSPQALAAWKRTIPERNRVEIIGAKRLEAMQSLHPGLVWYPKSAALTARERYWVEITGLRHAGVEGDPVLSYYVEGFQRGGVGQR